MPMLPGGDIIPSILAVHQRSSAAEETGSLNFNNFFLRVGEVIELVYPDDTRSRSGRLLEYRVLVQESTFTAGAGRIYENCLLINTFGGIADFCNYTLRVDKTENRDKAGLAMGSKVLILCVNGEQNTALIIGGVRDQTDTRDKDIIKDLGHNLHWQFNGINATINKDGELEILYKGKTNIDGKVNDDVDSNAPNAKIQFLKNGNINIGTRDNKQQVLLDNENGKISIQRDKALEIGEHTDKMLLGESFRNNHKQMHDEMKQQFNLMKDILQQAGTQLNTAGAATLAPGAPIPGLQAAGALLIAASQIAGQLAQTIDDFEVAGQGKNSYLSKKNSSD